MLLLFLLALIFNAEGAGEGAFSNSLNKAITKMDSMGEIIKDPYNDCSEIAESLYKASGNQGQIIRFESNTKLGEINVTEFGKTESFTYHEVYSDGKYILDPRYSSNPILKTDYINMLKKMNPGDLKVIIK